MYIKYDVIITIGTAKPDNECRWDSWIMLYGNIRNRKPKSAFISL